jgi:MipA family protein
MDNQRFLGERLMRKFRPSGRHIASLAAGLLIKLSWATCLTVCLLASPVSADDATYNGSRGDDQSAPQKDWKVMLGLGTGVSPNYEGSSDYALFAAPFINIVWRDTVSIGMDGLNVNILHGQNYRAGLGLTFDPGRSEDGKWVLGIDLSNRSDSLHGLGDIDPSLGIKAFGSYMLSPVEFRVAVAKFTGDQNDGIVVNLGASLPYRLTEKLTVSPNVKATWADGDYMQAYFGVNHQQALNSAFSPFDAGAGFKDVGAGLNVTYKLDQHWSVGADAGIKYLLGDAAASPISESDIGASFMTRVGYQF